MEERDSAVTKADEGAADLKKKVAELSEILEKYEKEQQVNTVSSCLCFTLIALTLLFGFGCTHMKLFVIITMDRVY